MTCRKRAKDREGLKRVTFEACPPEHGPKFWTWVKSAMKRRSGHGMKAKRFSIPPRRAAVITIPERAHSPMLVSGGRRFIVAIEFDGGDDGMILGPWAHQPSHQTCIRVNPGWRYYVYSKTGGDIAVVYNGPPITLGSGGGPIDTDMLATLDRMSGGTLVSDARTGVVVDIPDWQARARGRKP